MRGFAAAAVCASAVAAGTMADSSGKPMAAVPLLSRVRRDKCFFVMNISVSSGASELRIRNGTLCATPRTIDSKL